MYRLGERPQKRTNLLLLGLMFLSIIGLLGGGVWYLSRNSSKIQNPGVVVRSVSDTNGPNQAFDESNFTINLPNDWRLEAKSPTHYTWRSTKKDQDDRTLNLYFDQIPATLAVTRMVPVRAEGDHLFASSVSDDCSNFTGIGAGGAQSKGAAAAPAKWQGIDFVCDLSQPNRNAVGTSSADGVNKVTLSGKTSGHHALFFLYIDQNISPNYTIFYNALSSFRLK